MIVSLTQLFNIEHESPLIYITPQFPDFEYHYKTAFFN